LNRRVLLVIEMMAAAAIGCQATAVDSAGRARALAFAVQPVDASANQLITPAVRVVVLDASGDTVRDFAGSVTISLGATTTGAVLSGTVTQPVANGVATFADLSINRSGGGYTLSARAPGLGDAISGEFGVRCLLNCWNALTGMPTRRTLLATGVLNGAVYAVGGFASGQRSAKVEAYDPAANSWTTKAALPTARFGLGVGVVNGVLYAVGGALSGANPTNAVEAYDTVTNHWTTRALLPTPRLGLGVAVVNGRLFAIGGDIGNGRDTAVVEMYDPTTDTWVAKAPLPSGRAYFGTAVVGGVIYVVGGDADGSSIAQTLAYDPVTDTWTSRAPLAVARSSLSAASVDGYVYAVGGNDTQVVGTVERYDPVGNVWVSRAPLLAPRALLSVGELGGLLYAIGGSTVTASFLATNEAYQP